MTTPTCRGNLAHQSRPAVARVWFYEPQGTPIDTTGMPVCKACSKEMLAWMKDGTVNCVGQYPTAHYPIERS